ncbi:MAG TPA: ABC transporter permease subunit [Micromonosporaceae bacterium]|nr:ABC transporter permease subunit [Micromonosporaceae bacterium]
MSPSSRRVRAVIRKELRDFRRNRSLTVGMAIVPVLFCVQPLVTVFTLDPAASAPLRHEHVLLYMLGIPALVPSFVAAYSVVGERQQGTLEPVLTTPIRREELLLGKALAALLPSLAVAYTVYGLFLACVELFAAAAVASALIRLPDLLAQLFFTPLLAGWSIWVAILISTRSDDVRVAQQFAVLASLPTIAMTTLVALNVIKASLVAGLVAAVALLLLNRIGWRLASALFDRERLITGTR